MELDSCCRFALFLARRARVALERISGRGRDLVLPDVSSAHVLWTSDGHSPEHGRDSRTVRWILHLVDLAMFRAGKAATCSTNHPFSARSAKHLWERKVYLGEQDFSMVGRIGLCGRNELAHRCVDKRSFVALPNP